ncbi:hypothetical protein [Burkholderia sp. 3C]
MSQADASQNHPYRSKYNKCHLNIGGSQTIIFKKAKQSEISHQITPKQWFYRTTFDQTTFTELSRRKQPIDYLAKLIIISI